MLQMQAGCQLCKLRTLMNLVCFALPSTYFHMILHCVGSATRVSICMHIVGALYCCAVFMWMGIIPVPVILILNSTKFVQSALFLCQIICHIMCKLPVQFTFLSRCSTLSIILLMIMSHMSTTKPMTYVTRCIAPAAWCTRDCCHCFARFKQALLLLIMLQLWEERFCASCATRCQMWAPRGWVLLVCCHIIAWHVFNTCLPHHLWITSVTTFYHCAQHY